MKYGICAPYWTREHYIPKVKRLGFDAMGAVRFVRRVFGL